MFSFLEIGGVLLIVLCAVRVLFLDPIGVGGSRSPYDWAALLFVLSSLAWVCRYVFVRVVGMGGEEEEEGEGDEGEEEGTEKESGKSKRVGGWGLLLFVFASLALQTWLWPAKGPRAGGQAVIVDVARQTLTLYVDATHVKAWPVSTSKYGIGNKPGSYRTPIGRMIISRKIGAGAPSGAVFKSRKPTGEVIAPDAPGRDPVVTRILWLRGDEGRTRGVLARYVYIHGTPEEKKIGSPASYGCIRMRSRDIIDFFDRVKEGTPVVVVPGRIRREGGDG